ncbi:MAG: indole-3-glycerol phosphate synthase TrpC [Bacteroidales bacterium]|nr:indole-3-glycerol phosphate synthase TrpC [Bacteroidales bacterium]
MSILETIVKHKKKEVESCKELIPISKLKNMPLFGRKTYSLRESLVDPGRSGIIAEFKRRSPSKGIINDGVKVEKVTRGYAAAGASGLSVLTDFNFFGGSVDDLQKARAVNDIPILRKEFIIDPYQVYEAKAIGADAILLIAAILTKKEASDLALLARDLDLQVLMELHDLSELEILNEHLDIVGVNNRNLNNFEVSLENSVRLAKQIPDHFLKISESGIRTTSDIAYLKQYGFQGFLIGENFMRETDPAAALAAFTNPLKD